VRLLRKPLTPAADRLLAALGSGIAARRRQLSIEASQGIRRRALVAPHRARRGVTRLVLELALKVCDRVAPRLLPVLEHATKLTSAVRASQRPDHCHPGCFR